MGFDKTCDQILSCIFQWTLYEYVNAVDKSFDGNDGV